ncbi:Multimeric flavodoxin WrbA [Streptomyces sp. LamerLS-316]|uniref:flavodoxin family protein n=1 Tax=unclassified Streptomyces TaxID=2593676 RepID=UPI000823EEE8|nr:MULTISPECIES: NAD(P)H-dependent oxidoreductase [unclassified Streptomyces]MYQ42866.1 flavodoxin [Streptomyces sp. SID4921]SCK33307.1 Multimeric flavodoxin WrbA [Streptomyces sp. LamerLS-316]
MTTRNFLFLLGSSRTGGNTETLAGLAAEQLPAGTEQRWLDLRELPLPDFEDRRHADGHYTPTGNSATLLEATLAATDVVIASPLYWYAVSTSTKRYLDHWSGWLEAPGVDFKQRMAGKTLWGVTALADTEPEVADPLAGTLRNSARYLGMRWGGVLLGNGTRPGDVLTDTGAAARAKVFFS